MFEIHAHFRGVLYTFMCFNSRASLNPVATTLFVWSISIRIDADKPMAERPFREEAIYGNL